MVITFNIYVYPLEKSVILKIAAADYIGKLAADGNIKLFVKGTVAETEQRFATQDVVEIRKPTMPVTVIPPPPPPPPPIGMTVLLVLTLNFLLRGATTAT